MGEHYRGNCNACGMPDVLGHSCYSPSPRTDTLRCVSAGCKSSVAEGHAYLCAEHLGDFSRSPDCTEPAPSAPLSLLDARVAAAGSRGEISHELTRDILDEFLTARARIAELESNKRALEGVYAVAVEDQEAKAERIAALEAGVKAHAAKCWQCGGTTKTAKLISVETGYDNNAPCLACADLRALLSQEQP